ncbi:CHAT domain-containing protein [Phaeosphaeriaceae sp. PMI808]|nr:CHAT domain-containing protein [Phaeosphaeriaceae sp. PMI808]
MPFGSAPASSQNRSEAQNVAEPDLSLGGVAQDATESLDQAPCPPSGDRAGFAYLRWLSSKLNQRYEVTGAARDRNEAIYVSRLVLLSKIGIEGIEIASAIDVLSDLLEERFLETRTLPDIDEAILWRKKAVELDLSGESELWYSDANKLSRALLDRYRASKVTQDVEDAINWAFKAMNTISFDHEDYDIISYQLAVAHQAKWERFEDLKSLNEEIRWYRESIRFLEPKSPYFRHRENLLGVALCIRADISRSACDMEESLHYLIATRDNSVKGSEEYIRSLNNLANAYETAADIDGLDTEEAIKHALEAARLAVHEAPFGYGALDICFYNLANIKELEYRKTGVSDALYKAIEAARMCVEKTPPNHPRQQKNVAALGILVGRLYEETVDSDDFNEAVQLLRQALGLVPSESLTLPRTLNQLGLTYAKGFKVEGNLGYLDSAINYLIQAADCLSDINPITAGILMHLFDLLGMRSRDSDDVKQAIQVAERAFNTSAMAPSIRLRAAYGAGTLMSTSDPTQQVLSKAAKLLAQAVQLLPLFTPMHVARLEQQRRLKAVDASRMTSDAVALSLETENDPVTGLSLLETGRGVILGNLLRYRLDISRLRDAHPNLADDVERLREAIEKCQESIELSLPDRSGDSVHPREHYRLRMAQVVDELNKTYERIRLEAKFEDFMLPLSFDRRRIIKNQGDYIITINLSARRCDAIVMSNDRISLVSLPKLSLAEVSIREREFRYAIMNRRQTPDSCRQVLVSLLCWLWQACGEPLMASLGLLEATPRPRKPRVWWVLGGLLGRLPVHACGNYTIRAGGFVARTMYECVVSSYVPTARALEYAQERAAEQSNAKFKAHNTLVVAVPKSEGSASLLEAEVEALEIQGLVRWTLLQTNPSLSDVIDALQDCETAHFACHGISNEKNPAKSYLKLRDYKEKPLSVDVLMKTKMTKMRSCKFAYLSACDTAYSANEQLADESLHLVSGFLLAGCPQVVGTLWEIPDDQAREVAKAFYSLLPRREDGGLDVCRAAEILHSVINGLREDPRFAEDPLVWAPFIHAGI